MRPSDRSVCLASGRAPRQEVSSFPGLSCACDRPGARVSALTVSVKSATEVACARCAALDRRRRPKLAGLYSVRLPQPRAAALVLDSRVPRSPLRQRKAGEGDAHAHVLGKAARAFSNSRGASNPRRHFGSLLSVSGRHLTLSNYTYASTPKPSEATEGGVQCCSAGTPTRPATTASFGKRSVRVDTLCDDRLGTSVS